MRAGFKQDVTLSNTVRHVVLNKMWLADCMLHQFKEYNCSAWWAQTSQVSSKRGYQKYQTSRTSTLKKPREWKR
jgi:hypothetical protein